jgi:predicted dehydrogenase
MVEFENDTSLAFETHWAANIPRRLEYWVYGSDGGCHIDVRNERVRVYDYGASESTETLTTEIDGQGDGRVIDAFLRAVDGEATNLADLDDAIRTQRIIETIYEQV